MWGDGERGRGRELNVCLCCEFFGGVCVGCCVYFE